MQGFISQELTWVESHLLCVIWSVVKGEGCRQLLLTSLLLANNRYLRGRLPEELSKLPWQTKAKVQKVMRAQPQGGPSWCASRRDHGGRLEAPLCHGHRGRSLWRPALSGPLQLLLCLEASIYSWPLSLEHVPSSGPARQMCAPHQCVMTGRHNSCAQFHLWVWLRSKGLDEQWSYGRCLIHSKIWTQPVCQEQLILELITLPNPKRT